MSDCVLSGNQLKSPVNTEKVKSCFCPTKPVTPLRSSSREQSKILAPFVSPLLKRPLEHDLKSSKRKKCKLEGQDNEMIQESLDDDDGDDDVKKTSKDFDSTKRANNLHDTPNQINCRVNLHYNDDGRKGDVKAVYLSKKELLDKIREKEETIRKLKMVKTYRKKNNLDILQDLINKWRLVSQEAAERLLVSSPEPKPKMAELLDYLRIDHELIQYSEEDETFY